MDFNHSEDRRMLTDSLRRYLGDQYSVELRNASAFEEPYHTPQTWKALSELGILSALVSEQHGGFGGHGFDISVVFEEMGRALCAEPMLSTLMGLKLLSAYDNTALINEVSTGAKRIAVAIYEPNNSDSLTNLSTTAVQKGKQDSVNWLLNGQKSVVYGAPGADILLVLANTGNGSGLFLTESATVSSYAMIDGGGAGEIHLKDTPAICLAEDALTEIEAALDAGRLALCAEAVGTMDVLLAMTVDYLGQRQQFGTAIATFQALQHRVVDMAIEIEQCRSITTLAASKLGTDDRSRYVAMAKNLIGRGAILIGEEATQLHGGIGMTWEYAGSHYAKRLIMIDHQLGDRYQQLSRMG
jgi:alkylation response protein AidB-like acyl-CoA dehydrogenase